MYGGVDPSGLRMFGGGDAGGSSNLLGTAEKANKELGCCYVLSVMAVRADLPYEGGNGEQLLDKIIKNVSKKESGIGHAWVRLVKFQDKEGTIDQDEQFGHTGDQNNEYFKILDYLDTANGRGLTNGQLDLSKTPNMRDAFNQGFVDVQNPALIAQYVMNDGYNHGSGYSKRPSIEGSYCVSKEQYEAALEFANNKDYSRYGGFNEGCAVFAADVMQKAGLRRPNIRYDHDLPQVYRMNLFMRFTLWTPGTANANRARKISFEYPDALADKYLSNAPFKAGG